MALRCPTCGQLLKGRRSPPQKRKGRSKVEWVDALKLWKIIEPFVDAGDVRGREPMRINGVVIEPHENYYIHSIKRAAIGERKRTRANRAEALLIKVHLDPHLIEECLV